jgi:hypothetical protein
MHEYSSVDHVDAKSWDFFLKWRRSCTVLRSILVSVPRAGDAAIDDAAFS